VDLPSAPSSDLPGSRPPPAGVLPGLAIVLAGLAAYANSLAGPFIFDDIDSIRDNPTIRHLWPMGEVLRPSGNLGPAGRPLLNLSFALNRALGGSDVRGYHAANLAIHLCAGLVLYGILRRTFGRMAGAEGAPTAGGDRSSPRISGAFLAFAVALLWTVHPLQTEAVTYISQRAESLMGLFYLLTLYSFIRYMGVGAVERGSIPTPNEAHPEVALVWGILSIGACLLGSLTKEVIVTAPVAVLLYDRTFVSGSFAGALRRRWGYYASLAACWLVVACLLPGVHQRGVGFGEGVRWWAYALGECPVVLRYLGLAFCPLAQNLDTGGVVADPSWAEAPCVAAMLLLVGLSVVLLLRKERPAAPGRSLGFAGALFFLLLAPTSSVVPITGQPMAEHRMYLPLAALLAIVACGVNTLLGRRGLSLLLALAVGFCWLTVKRNNLYASELQIWSDVVAKSPGNARARNNLGVALSAKGLLAEAEDQYREALRLKPDYANAHNDLGNALYSMGRVPEALAEYQAALRAKPGYAEAHNNLGYALFRTGRVSAAIPEFENALRLKPAFADAHVNLGNAFEATGRIPEAIAEFEWVLRIQPGNRLAATALEGLRRGGARQGAPTAR
jgi:tetratricopeptide (TPR) repeat protein